ncbi:MAG: hypothetical protein R2857_13880 [Vampirovibrionales bacterium]
MFFQIVQFHLDRLQFVLQTFLEQFERLLFFLFQLVQLALNRLFLLLHLARQPFAFAQLSTHSHLLFLQLADQPAWREAVVPAAGHRQSMDRAPDVRQYPGRGWFR